MDPDFRVALAFLEDYYNTFDTNRADLASFYHEESMLTFNGEKIKGSKNIVAKLRSLPFIQCKHLQYNFDFQPSDPVGGMVVSVFGSLDIYVVQPLGFTQMFHLMRRSDGKYYVWNDIFRFNNTT